MKIVTFYVLIARHFFVVGFRYTVCRKVYPVTA